MSVESINGTPDLSGQGPVPFSVIEVAWEADANGDVDEHTCFIAMRKLYRVVTVPGDAPSSFDLRIEDGRNVLVADLPGRSGLNSDAAHVTESGLDGAWVGGKPVVIITGASPSSNGTIHLIGD